MNVLHWGDFLALVSYFAIVIGIGFWSSCQNRGSSDGYFIARRSMHFIPIGASLFASNIGSGHFIGLAGSAAAGGIGVATFELTAIFSLIFLGWIFLPVYIRAGVSTMPEYIKKRFGGDRIRIYLSCLSLILYIFTKISADLFSGALFIKLALGLDLYFAICILLVIAAFFTIGGGASAVIWTDFIQTIFMIVGATFLAIKGFIEVGGFSAVYTNYGYSVPKSVLFSNATCGLPNDEYFNLIRSFNTDLPWSGMTFGLATIALWYWCSDQVIVQRALAAKNITHARAGCILAGFLKFFPLFLMVFPGMIGKMLYPDSIGCADPAECIEICGNPKGCTNYAYPNLVINLMPIGAKGLMLAVMIAALMSSLTSIFNSSSVIFTIDIWRRIRPQSKESELMVVGRLFIIFLVAVSICWIPIIEKAQGSRLFDYIQAIQSYLAPPIAALYVLAMFSPRTNETGAFWGLMAGLVIGLTRFIWQFSYPEPGCGEYDPRPSVISKVHYMNFAVILFVLTCMTMYGISLLTKPLPKKNINRLTIWSIYEDDEPVPIKSVHRKNCNFCVGADLDDTDEEEVVLEDGNINVKKQKKDKIYKKPSIFKVALFWICGIESSLKKMDDDYTEKVSEPVDTSIDQNKFWSNVMDISAIFSLALAGFVLAFINRY